MNVVEKHGAYWHRNDDEGDLVFEAFEEGSGLIGAVHQRRTGLYVVRLFKKIDDPGFELPVWDAIRPGALFDNLNEAKTHILALLAKKP